MRSGFLLLTKDPSLWHHFVWTREHHLMIQTIIGGKTLPLSFFVVLGEEFDF